MVYVALTDAPLLNLIFQRRAVPIPNFNVNAFHFSLLVIDEDDIVIYQITYGDFVYHAFLWHRFVSLWS